MNLKRTHRGDRRGEAWTTVTRGVHRAADSPTATHDTLAAWLDVLPEDTRLTHLTAARAYGMWLPLGTIDARVHVTVTANSRPRRPRLRVHRPSLLQPPRRRSGLLLDAPADVVRLAVRDLSELDALVLIDSALHARLCCPDELMLPHTPGVSRMRDLLDKADARSESAWETVLREFHRHVGAPVTPQFEVRTATGEFVARGDLVLDGHRVLHEYDGAVHLTREAQSSDLHRARRLVEAGWTRRGYTSVDLVRRPHEVLRDIDLTLGRPHDLSRLAAWFDTVRASSLHPSGRRELEERLR